jgi:hypothetical protein
MHHGIPKRRAPLARPARQAQTCSMPLGHAGLRPASGKAIEDVLRRGPAGVYPKRYPGPAGGNWQSQEVPVFIGLETWPSG